MEFTKAAIFIYVIFTIFLTIFGQTQGLFYQEDLTGDLSEEKIKDTSSDSTISTTFNWFTLFISLIVYNVPSNWVINWVLWCMRAIILLEVVVYLKNLFHPILQGSN